MTGIAGPLTRVTAVVADLDAALGAYHDGVRLRRTGSGRVAAALARAWRRPALSGRRWAQLGSPGDDRPGSLRLIEMRGVVAPAPLSTPGWAAAELIVTDADEATERARSAGLHILAEPAPVGAGGGLRAVQVAGPAGEALYLTEVRASPPGFELPRAISAVGRVFIAVLASTDLERSRAFLEGELAAQRVTDHPLAVRALNGALGLPAGTRHRVSTVQLSGESAIETDQYPATAGARPEVDGVTGGIVAVTVRGASAARARDVPAAGAALLDFE